MAHPDARWLYALLRIVILSARGKMCTEERVMNVATEARKPDRPVTLERFDFGTEKESAAQITHPTDLGCVDWYLYPVNRNPTSREPKPEANLTRGLA
jgi:hypothetical protein